MNANVGYRIVVRGHRTGQPVRARLVLEARGSRGGVPYLVRRADSGHENPFFPGSDATVDHVDRAC